MDTWIRSLPPNVPVRLALFSEGDVPRLAFFLGENERVRRRFLRSRALFLNATGNPLYDEISLEYNSFPSSSSLPCSLKEILDLLPGPWEEFFLPALDAGSFPGNCLDQPIRPYRIIVDQEEAAPYVDLELVRQGGGDYLSLLSANTRRQIRKAWQELEQRGPVILEEARNLDEAMEIYGEMAALHSKAWQARGQAGSFASAYFDGFHRELIGRRFSSGEIQLLRLRAGGRTIGCLYNFVYQGRVSFYQSGIDYAGTEELKPGILCHVEAVRLNAARGHRVYDFLGGSARYKNSLATHQGKLVWARVQKPRVKFWLERKGKILREILRPQGELNRQP